MVRTFKVKHNCNLDVSLFEKARKVALFTLEHGIVSTKDLKHIGLHSHIANQVNRKYGQNKNLKNVNLKRVKLIVPGQSLRFNKEKRELYVRPLRIHVKCWFPLGFTKINQVEIDDKWAYVSVTLPDVEEKKSDHFIGIDLNSTSHSIVIADPITGKVEKFGKEIPHIKRKYRNIRKNLQKQKRFKELKKIKNREHRKTQDVLHKITRKIVNDAAKKGTGIKLEELTGICKKNTKKFRKEHNFTLNSWPFYQFRLMLCYKAKELGIEVAFVDPAWTSTTCSKCGNVDKEARKGKVFHCTKCEHVEHADVNAAFNVAKRPKLDSTKKEIRGRGRRKRKFSDVKSPRSNSK